MMRMMMKWVRVRGVRLHSSYDGPSEGLKRRMSELGKKRKNESEKRRKNQVFVEVPESLSYLDTATMPMYLAAAGMALFAKLLMMYDDSRSQELIERKIRNAPAEQGTVRMLSREEWEEIRAERPRTPFESKLARPNARLRTGEPIRKEDLKDWTIDVFTDAFVWAEESVRRSSRTSPAEFIVPFDQYMESVKNNYSIGMRFKMRFEGEEAPEQRFTGTINKWIIHQLVMSLINKFLSSTAKMGQVKGQCSSTRSCTKVHKQGIALGRSVDLTKFNNYDELIAELDQLFEFDGELMAPKKNSLLVYTDDENDMMLVGDDPWQECLWHSSEEMIL